MLKIVVCNKKSYIDVRLRFFVDIKILFFLFVLCTQHTLSQEIFFLLMFHRRSSRSSFPVHTLRAASASLTTTADFLYRKIPRAERGTEIFFSFFCMV